MDTPNFVVNQYIDAASLNGAATITADNFGELSNSAFFPGLVSPDAIGFSSAGLTLTTTLPLPFEVLFGNGQLAQAHGTQTNADTQSYSTSFSGVVPVSGSVTAYLLASFTTIQQNPFQVVGPPVGHPDYNPDFVPYTAYSTTVNSLALNASTTAPDNLTTFELCRFTLAAGASSLGPQNTAYQVRLSGNNIIQSMSFSASAVAIGDSEIGRLSIATSATVFTLPDAVLFNNTTFGFASFTSGTVTIQTSAGRVIYGTIAQPATGVSNFTIPQGTTVWVSAVAGAWQIVGGSQYGVNQAVSNAISGLASTSYVISYVASEIAPLATISYVNSEVAGLASVSYVNSAVAGLASVSYVDSYVASAIAGLASVSYVNSAVAGLASVSYVNSAVAGLAPEASPTFSGTVSMAGASTVTAPTVASVADSSTKVATTAFVQNVIDTFYPTLVAAGRCVFTTSGGSITTSELYGCCTGISRTSTGIYNLTCNSANAGCTIGSTGSTSPTQNIGAGPSGGIVNGSNTITFTTPAITLNDPLRATIVIWS